MVGKQCRVSFQESNHRANKPLKLVHSDVWGPAPTCTRGGARYFLTFTDARKSWLYLLREKNEVQALESYGQSNHAVKCLRTEPTTVENTLVWS